MRPPQSEDTSKRPNQMIFHVRHLIGGGRAFPIQDDQAMDEMRIGTECKALLHYCIVETGRRCSLPDQGLEHRSIGVIDNSQRFVDSRIQNIQRQTDPLPRQSGKVPAVDILI